MMIIQPHIREWSLELNRGGRDPKITKDGNDGNWQWRIITMEWRCDGWQVMGDGVSGNGGNGGNIGGRFGRDLMAKEYGSWYVLILLIGKYVSIGTVSVNVHLCNSW